MVLLSGVSKWYLNGPRVLDHIQLELKKGEFAYLVGGSGAGKSTLLRLIATEEAPSEGKVSLFGYDLSRVSPSTLRAIRRSIGYVPQNIRLIHDLTVYDNIAMSLSLAGRRSLGANAKQRIQELLERLGLTAKRDVQAANLSGGEAQRVAVARALVRAPELLIADEPTGAQDRDFTWSLIDLLVRANLNGAATLVATHDREIVRRVRKRCIPLQGGRLQQQEAACIL